MPVHLCERDAEFLRFRAILVPQEIRALVVQQNEIGDAVFTQRLVLDHGDRRVGFECRKQRRIADGSGRVDPVTHPFGAFLP